MGNDVFISHSTKDKVFADAVCAALERAGVRCWVAPRDILPGASWATSILKAIGDSRMMVLVFSGHAQTSQHIRREVERAVHHGLPIAPVRIEDVMPADDLEYYLSSSHWMDAITPPFEKHLKQLAEKVKVLLDVEGAGTGVEAASAKPPAEHPVYEARAGRAGPASPPRRGRRRLIGALVACAVVGLLAPLLGLGTWGNFARLFSSTGPRPMPSTTDGSPSPTPAATRPAPATPAPIPGESAAQREAREAREAADARRRTRLAALLATAKANDGPELDKSNAALAALDELLRDVDPTNAEARTLREKVRGYRRTFTNSLHMRLVELKPGEFMMGSPTGEAGRYVEETLHRVKLTKPYMLGVHEVTRGQFAAFAKAAHYQTDAEKEGFAHVYNGKEFEKKAGASFRDVGFDQTDDHPVVNVSWNDAKAFCDWLSGQEKKPYRLPTEAEWEYACRAGTTTAYPWGEDPDKGRGWANAADLTAEEKFPGWATFNWADGFVFTAPNGSFKPNAWGLYDMIGNASEWCGDWYDAYPSGDAVDPKAPLNPPAARVLRGGSWNCFPGNCRAAHRSDGAPDFRSNIIGFRLCLDFEQPSALCPLPSYPFSFPSEARGLRQLGSRVAARACPSPSQGRPRTSGTFRRIKDDAPQSPPTKRGVLGAFRLVAGPPARSGHAGTINL